MTFKEKWEQEHQDKGFGGVIGEHCPFEYGYEPPGKGLCNVYKSCSCDDCWNREMPKENEMKKEFTKADLRTGQLVTLRNKQVYRVLLNAKFVQYREQDIIQGVDGFVWNFLDNYHSDLTYMNPKSKGLDIMKVSEGYSPKGSSDITTIWERKEEPTYRWKYKCVIIKSVNHEGDKVVLRHEIDSQANIEKKAEEIFKDYCKEHEGVFRAVVEKVYVEDK